MAFNIADFLNEESKKEMQDDFIIKKIPAEKLHPSKKNFYKMDKEEINALKETIELVGVQENLVVKPLGNGEYEIISGHKRHRAVTELIREGKEISNLLPCKVEDATDGVRSELILIFTNSTQRERSDYCKMFEIQRVRELLEEYGQNNHLPGRKRDIIAGILNTSKTTIGKLDNIRRNIIQEFMEEYKKGKISTHAANQIAGADEEGQRLLWERYQENGTIYGKEVMEYKEPKEEQPEDNVHEDENHAHNGEELADEDRTVDTEQTEELEEEFDPQPETVTSLCYSCTNYEQCDEKRATVTNCNNYINRREAYKTEEERYNEEQTAIDRETKRKLQEMKQEEKMKNLPSEEQPRQRDIRLSRHQYEEIRTGMLTFLLLKKDGFSIGEEIELEEYRDGLASGRKVHINITYILEDYTGIEDDYCIIGFKVKG